MSTVEPLRYDNGRACGPDVVRLHEFLSGQVTGEELFLASEERIEFQPMDPVGPWLNGALVKHLDLVVAQFCHPSTAGENVENVYYVSGCIGSLCVTSRLFVYGSGKEGSLAGFRAMQLGSPVQAEEHARQCAQHEVICYVREALHVARHMTGAIKGAYTRGVCTAVVQAAKAALVDF